MHDISGLWAEMSPKAMPHWAKEFPKTQEMHQRIWYAWAVDGVERSADREADLRTEMLTRCVPSPHPSFHPMTCQRCPG